MNSEALKALRTLLDPAVVAAWLDEVDAHRARGGIPSSPPAPKARDAISSERLLSVDGLSKRLGIRRNAIYAMVRMKTIPHIRIGSRIWFAWTRVQEWLDDPQSETGREAGRSSR